MGKVNSVELNVPDLEKIETDNLVVVPIHARKDLINDCCDLINSEWPRSKTARLRSLEMSREDFPTSLVMVNSDNQLIGHCKISPVPNVSDSCFVESVVIDKRCRGKGLGKLLMMKTESYVMTCGKSTIYLSTKGQEIFYTKLGYAVCEPVTIYGTFQRSSDDEQSRCTSPTSGVEAPPVITVQFKKPPVPPPPPPSRNFGNRGADKTFMKKVLTPAETT
nr:PREDICTED: N-acetyltransferase 6-like [Bemisia tabaci]